jgi:hypothetical protein
VRSLKTLIPAEEQTNDKSALSSNRYRSAWRLGRKGFESQSWMVFAITPRHRRVSAVISSELASAISLIMFCNPLAARAEFDSKYVIKDALIGPNALIKPYIPMGCEGTHRR